jgi:hypothetical protein
MAIDVDDIFSFAEGNNSTVSNDNTAMLNNRSLDRDNPRGGKNAHDFTCSQSRKDRNEAPSSLGWQKQGVILLAYLTRV